jgi:AAA domain
VRGDRADFLGFPVNKGKALYINLELFEAEAKNRLRLISKAMGFAKIPENNIDVVSFKGKKLTTAKLMKYAEGMRAAGYVLVVVDPIYKPYIGRDENSIEGVSGILHEFEVLAMAINASAVFAHHFSKGPQAYKEAMDRASGSGGFSRSPDTLLALTKNEAEKGITVEIDLRSFPPIKPFGIRHRFPIFERDDTIDPAKVVDREKKPRKHPDELMLIPLRVKPEGLRYTEWFKAINGGKKVISDSQFERRVKELKQEKKVVVGINKCYKEAEAVEVAQFVEGLGGDQS